MKELLQIRTKRKKPDFIRQQGRGLKNLEKKWRAPKGMHSKLRKKLRGHIKTPSIGYSSPKLIRGFSPSGFKQVLITNEKQVAALKKGEAVILSKRLGERKRIKILRKIQEKNIIILNIKDINGYILKIEDQLKKRKQSKKEEIKTKEESKKETIETPKQKEETEEEKEKREKEEKRKVLEGKI